MPMTYGTVLQAYLSFCLAHKRVSIYGRNYLMNGKLGEERRGGVARLDDAWYESEG